MQDYQVLLHLSLIKGVGPALINRLIEHSGIEHLFDYYDYTAAEFVHKLGLSLTTATVLVNGLSDKQIIEHEFTLLERHKISYISIVDGTYPALLREIHLPPTILYIHGSLSDTASSLAIVGSRQGNHYAQRVINSVVPSLVSHGWTIVSGGALGVDAMAHEATLNERGHTIVVLGSGLLKPYPSQNRRLFERVIEQGGALISSFALETSALPGNFPARNRIIAGLSKGCMVVQAAEQSGARITATFALEQGREVFAVPGPIDDPLSGGCHRLIQQGAKLVTCVADILQEFGHYEQQSAQMIGDNIAVQISDTSAIASDNQHYSEAERSILNLCQQPRSLDSLVDVLQRDIIEIQSAILDLQLQGKITQNFLGLWHNI